MSKLQEALAHSNKRAAQRGVKIQTTVQKDEAWPGTDIVRCPACSQRVDLCNPAIKRDGTCVCGEQLLCADGRPVAALRARKC